MQLCHRNPSPLRRPRPVEFDRFVRQRGTGLFARVRITADISQDQRVRRNRLEVGAGEFDLA